MADWWSWSIGVDLQASCVLRSVQFKALVIKIQDVASLEEWGRAGLVTDMLILTIALALTGPQLHSYLSPKPKPNPNPNPRPNTHLHILGARNIFERILGKVLETGGCRAFQRWMCGMVRL